VIYPRFLGIDGSGDFVWELASGRWTWGDDPHSAVTRERTFEPERYVEKYGRPVPIGEQIDRQAEAELEPAESLAMVGRPEVLLTTHHLDGTKTVATRAEPDSTREADKMAGARRATVLMLGALDGWIEGARANHDGLGHRGENVGEECWTQFHPNDIRNMVNDVNREMGMSEFAAPEVAKEDEVR
jgi:hypothetical protein